MTEIQQEHARAVEDLSSRLAAVHRELCPAFISDGRFWKIYFVFLHSRLSKEDAELLSTSQVRRTTPVFKCIEVQPLVSPSSLGEKFYAGFRRFFGGLEGVLACKSVMQLCFLFIDSKNPRVAFTNSKRGGT